MTEQRVPLFVDPWRRYKKTAKWLLAIIAVYLLLVAVVDWVIPTWFRLRANHYIYKFQDEPSQELANILLYLLDHQLVSKATGDKILQMLTYPKVLVRDAYPPGKDGDSQRIGTACLIPPWNLNPFETYMMCRLQDPRVQFSEIWIMHERGSEKDYNNTIALNRNISQKYYVYVYMDDNGSFDHEFQVPYTISVTPLVRRYGILQLLYAWTHPNVYWELGRKDNNFLPIYQCTYYVPIVIKQRPVFTNPVKLVSNPELDEAMKESFHIREWNEGHGYEVDYDDVVYLGPSNYVDFTGLPHDVVFTYEIDTGTRKILNRKQPLWARKGEIGWFDTISAIDCPELTEVGTHNVTVILVPDLDAALQCPDINEIWDGTITYPFTYEIVKKDDVDTARKRVRYGNVENITRSTNARK